MFRKQMSLLGIQVVSATQHLGDITDPSDFLTELISVGLGEHQVLDTRKKSIAGTTERAKKGLFCGGVPPLGYDIEDGQYIINDAEANVVRKIFAMYAAGKGYAAILEAVKGVKGKRGKPIGKNSLYSILRNERYIGTYTWFRRKCKLMRKWAGGSPNPDAIRIDGVIPPIIDDKTWIEVQNRMDDNKRRASNKAKQEYPALRLDRVRGLQEVHTLVIAPPTQEGIKAGTIFAAISTAHVLVRLKISTRMRSRRLSFSS